MYDGDIKQGKTQGKNKENITQMQIQTGGYKLPHEYFQNLPL